MFQVHPHSPGPLQEHGSHILLAGRPKDARESLRQSLRACLVVFVSQEQCHMDTYLRDNARRMLDRTNSMNLDTASDELPPLKCSRCDEVPLAL